MSIEAIRTILKQTIWAELNITQYDIVQTTASEVQQSLKAYKQIDDSWNLQNQFESRENKIWKVAVAEERFLSAMLTWSFVYDV